MYVAPSLPVHIGQQTQTTFYYAVCLSTAKLANLRRLRLHLLRQHLNRIQDELEISGVRGQHGGVRAVDPIRDRSVMSHASIRRRKDRDVNSSRRAWNHNDEA